ncbi:hypothetical protein STEG23_038213 [Scotinomys teguina]
MCQLSWFLDPGGWSKAAAVGLYFIFPGICTLSLEQIGPAFLLRKSEMWVIFQRELYSDNQGENKAKKSTKK